MCDTMVALASTTLGGATLFAKNSDRERNESQFLDHCPAARHEPGSTLRCTYIDIPQAAETQAVLLSRPFWCWGAEIGANAAGVVIGNEAVFSHLHPPRREPALIGMDLVRLGLERAATAEAAVAAIIALLERHGQGGDCGHLNERYYDNAFLVADPREAFVLETVGRLWVAGRVQRARAISNALSIGRGAAWRTSPALIEDASARGLADDPAALDFAACYLDPERDTLTQGRARSARATELLARRDGTLTVADMMAVLRDHGPAAERDAAWHPARAPGRSICMHAAGHDRGGQTTASMVSEIGADGQAVHWVTGTAAPCLSIFKPVVIEAGLAPQGPRPTGHWGSATAWWQHETLHRGAVLGDFGAVRAALAPERDALEARFLRRMADATPTGRAEAAAQCWTDAAAWETAWRRRLLPGMLITDGGHQAAWQEFSGRAMAGTADRRGRAST
ncbi:MAG: hypothetical protein IT556_09385 [Acetobacteraceae bacterium]|nr:hypothetical protein [Acetobacteraceae bacterium]